MFRLDLFKIPVFLPFWVHPNPKSVTKSMPPSIPCVERREVPREDGGNLFNVLKHNTHWNNECFIFAAYPRRYIWKVFIPGDGHDNWPKIYVVQCAGSVRDLVISSFLERKKKRKRERERKLSRSHRYSVNLMLVECQNWDLLHIWCHFYTCFDELSYYMIWEKKSLKYEI